MISTNIFYKRNDFDFESANIRVLAGDVPDAAFYGVYISQFVLL